MDTKHTIEQLQAMSDGELAELTARLRYGTDTGFPGWNIWNPPADIGQAYGLLVWITAAHGWAGRVNFASPPSIELWKSGTGSAAVSGNDARAMVYAFVLAMQEVSNG
jgi:hypothetical protein